MIERWLFGDEILRRMMEALEKEVPKTLFPRRVFVPICESWDGHRREAASTVHEKCFVIRGATGVWIVTYGAKDMGWVLKHTYAGAISAVFLPTEIVLSEANRDSFVGDASKVLSKSHNFHHAILIAMCDGRLVWPKDPWDGAGTRKLVRTFRAAIRAYHESGLSLNRDLHYIDDARTVSRPVRYDSDIVPRLAHLLLETLRAT